MDERALAVAVDVEREEPAPVGRADAPPRGADHLSALALDLERTRTQRAFGDVVEADDVRRAQVLDQEEAPAVVRDRLDLPPAAQRHRADDRVTIRRVDGHLRHAVTRLRRGEGEPPPVRRDPGEPPTVRDRRGAEEASRARVGTRDGRAVRRRSGREEARSVRRKESPAEREAAVPGREVVSEQRTDRPARAHVEEARAREGDALRGAARGRTAARAAGGGNGGGNENEGEQRERDEAGHRRLLSSPLHRRRGRKVRPPRDSATSRARISAVDLRRQRSRRVVAWRARTVRSEPGCGAPGPAPPRTSRPSSASTGPAPTAPRTSSCTTRQPPRTSPRRRSSPPCARSTGSTAAGRSGPGCTGSSSTGRSTGPERGACAERSSPRDCSSWLRPPSRRLSRGRRTPTRRSPRWRGSRRSTAP